MNDSGQLVGYMGRMPGVHVLSWTETRGATLLAEIGHGVFYLSPEPRVSNGGRVVGTTGSLTPTSRATMWKTDPDSECVLLRKTIDGMSLPSGARATLRAKLSGARATLAEGDAASACDYVLEVITFASAQAGKRLTVDQANEIVGPAIDIRTMLQCP
jgi:hypothetical protein